MHLNSYRVILLGCEIRLSFLFNQKFNKIYYKFFNQTQSLHISMNFYTVRNSKFWSFIISSIIEYIFMHLPTTPTKKKIHVELELKKLLALNSLSLLCLSVVLYLQFPSLPLSQPFTFPHLRGGKAFFEESTKSLNLDFLCITSF